MDTSRLLAAIDTDGAIREAAEEVVTDTRAGFLKKAGVGSAALIGGSAFLGATPRLARGAAVPASDIAVLNFALTLEYLEGAFYAQAVKNIKFQNPNTNRFAHVVAQHEATHVAFLRKVLGAKAVARPKFDFRDTVTSEAKFIATAQALEDTGVHAYLGQIPNIKAKAVLVAASRILPVEARHAAWVRDIRFPNGGTIAVSTPAPAAFEDGFSKANILATVRATGFIVG